MPHKTSRKPKPLYRQKPPRAAKPKSKVHSPQSAVKNPKPDARSSTGDRGHETSDFSHPYLLAPSHFTLREDGSVVPTPDVRSQKSEVSSPTSDLRPPTSAPPRLAFSSDNPFLRLYCGNSLELLDAIFADPPYFLSNGGITCHAGKMVKVDKGDWDVSRGPELNHEFNTEWLRRCQKVLKPNGTIWQN